MKSTEEKNEEFVLNILHDIKSPIAGINIALENIGQEAFSESTLDILREIYKVNRHNLEYIENLMENYSLKKGKYQLKYEYFNLVSLIKEEIFALRFLIIEKNLKVSFLTPDENIPVYTDKQMIRQVFLNLLTNAVKYSPSAGEIVVETGKNKHRVSVCITNSISNKDSDKASGISTGFGSEIIKDAMARLSGKIYHTKSKNKICFNIELPKHQL